MTSSYMIHKANTDLWLASDIDSNGMSVFWTSLANGDQFDSYHAAKSMLKRAVERYPRDPMEIVAHD